MNLLEMVIKLLEILTLWRRCFLVQVEGLLRSSGGGAGGGGGGTCLEVLREVGEFLLESEVKSRVDSLSFLCFPALFDCHHLIGLYWVLFPDLWLILSPSSRDRPSPLSPASAQFSSFF